MGLFDFIGGILGGQNQQANHPPPTANIGDQQVAYYNQINPLVQQNQSYIDALRTQMNGGGPNLANAQLQQATNSNLRQQASMLGSTRGINPALAARYIGNQGSQIGQEAAAQSSVNRIQQQLMAQQQLGGQLGNSINSYGNLQNAQNNQNLDNYWHSQDIAAGANAQNSKQNTATGGAVFGGLANAAGGGLAALKPSGGGAPPAADPAMFGPAFYRGGYVDGGAVPGEAQFPGNDSRNDVVDAELSKGEIVLPNSVTQSPDAAEKAKSFVEAIQATHKPNEKVEYKHVLAHQKKMQELVQHLCGGGMA